MPLPPGTEVPVTKEKIYSRDRNIWHISHEGGPLRILPMSGPMRCWC